MRGKMGFDDIPRDAFIAVMRKRNIVRAVILKREDKIRLEKGSSDVVLMDPLGNRQFISRRNLVNEFRHLDGRMIKLSGWKSGKGYMVVQDDNTPALATMLPKRMRKQRNINQGYLVCPVNNEGNIDRESMGVMRGQVFRKMFTMPNNKLLAEYRDKRKSKVSAGNTGDIGKGQIDLRGIQDKNQERINNRPMDIKAKTDNTKTNRMSAIKTVVDSEGRIIGFIIRDARGINSQVNKREMLILCRKGAIDNIVAASRNNGKSYYLRGNGIKISDLASIRI